MTEKAMKETQTTGREVARTIHGNLRQAGIETRYKTGERETDSAREREYLFHRLRAARALLLAQRLLQIVNTKLEIEVRFGELFDFLCET